MRARIALVAFFAVAITATAGNDWPLRPIKLLVPATPGSTPDVFARVLAEGLREQVGQPVVIEHRPGAGGAIAVHAVVRAQPDGHTLAVTPPGPMGLHALLNQKLPYDPATELALVSIGATQANVVVARRALGVQTLADMLAALRRQPGQHRYAAVGIGSINHLCMEAIAHHSATAPTRINYPGTAQATLALLSGETDFACLPAQAVAEHLRSGQLRALAVATAQRSPFMPDVPTLKEAGVDGVEASAWMGVVAPAQTPPAVVQRLSTAIAQALSQPRIREQLASQFMQAVGSTPAGFEATLREDMQRWRPIVQARQIRVE